MHPRPSRAFSLIWAKFHTVVPGPRTARESTSAVCRTCGIVTMVLRFLPVASTLHDWARAPYRPPHHIHQHSRRVPVVFLALLTSHDHETAPIRAQDYSTWLRYETSRR